MVDGGRVIGVGFVVIFSSRDLAVRKRPASSS